MIRPTLSEAKAYLNEFDFVPVAYELMADTYTPVNLFLAAQSLGTNCFLLESAENAEQWGRYSFIGFDPAAQIRVRGTEFSIERRNGEIETILTDDPLKRIDRMMQERKSPRIEGMPHLTGGLVGYFGYDTVRYVEKTLVNPPPDDLGLPECHLLLCEELISLDHLRHTASIIVNVSTKGDFSANYEMGVNKAKAIAKALADAEPIKPTRNESSEILVKSNLTKEEFCENVRRAKGHIIDGDVFQIVLSQRFHVEHAPDSFDVYRALRTVNPSPYMYYFKLDEYRISGASPEMLVSVDNGLVATRPIAGTIRRGKDETEDKELERALLSDPKELAEHAMLLDLGRNDVGKVSRFGTVEVTRLMEVERYSALMHIVSDVQGELSEHKTGMDALMAVLPAGTLSGAPKVRAMELIDELETNKRGLYGGMVGYLSFDGRIDTCIAIRTILFANGQAYIQAGAGIVADSIPESEFAETQKKAEAMINAMKKARELR